VAKKNLAFTFPELLVVFAVIAILASLLLPVFRYAKSAAYKTTCLSNFKQVQLATLLYVADWDDRMTPVNHQPSAPANSQNDRTWVQLTLPYARSFGIFNCPSDYGVRPSAETTFDQDLVPGDTYSKYYSASTRVNAGYNYVYLAPVYLGLDRQWRSEPRSMSTVNSPSETLLYVDSVWGRTDDGTPFGGGSWLVVPPCRYLRLGNGRREDTFSLGGSAQVYTTSPGWKSDHDSPFVYGSAWPWHQGKMNLVRLDGSAKSISAEQLSAGCDVRENWQGSINDARAYIWDLN
jgi:type II secretory pathway pseudopilin PulG